MGDLDAETLARSLTERSPAGIAAQVRELMVEGTLVGGMRLPTVRDLAAELGTSIGTVAGAYGLLREGGLVETRRRGGTRIVDGTALDAEFPGWSSLDLLHCSPDQALLPDPADALAHAARQPDVHTWRREHVTDDLAAALSTRLTDQPRSFLAVSSGTEGLWLASHAAASTARRDTTTATEADGSPEAGPLIAVEEPAAPGHLAVLESLGLRAVGVSVDEDGPEPASLRAALDAGAARFVHSPSGPYSDRHVLSPARALELEKVLQEHPDVVVVENDALGPASEYRQGHSLDVLLPERTLRVLSLDRALGIDLRTSVLAGPPPLLDACRAHRSGGTAWTSRLLQHATAHLLRDPSVSHRLDSARTRYAVRRRTALEGFAEAGLSARSGPASWAMWVEVPDERAAALALARRSVTVDVGASSFVSAQQTGLLRLSTAQLPEDPAQIRELAGLVRAAAAGELDDITFV